MKYFLGLRKIRQQPYVKRKQFPLTLSWACIVHKVQGLSLNEGVVSFDLESQNLLIKGKCMLRCAELPALMN